MTSTVITDYIGRGVHADRPVSPPVSSGATAIYFETDTNKTFVWSGSVWVAAYSGSAVGTVTSVALTVPGELNLSGSPITSSGTLALSWANQTGNVVLASPSGGGSGTPGFRNLVPGDIPNLDTGKITTGTLNLARLSGITTTQLSSTAGIVSGQIASIPNQNASIITAGTLATARGGTALDCSAAANGQLLIGTGSGFSLATLTAGSNITITNASGTITIASTGGGGGAPEAIPGGYLSAFILNVHNGFTSTVGGSTTIPVLTSSTDYVVQATFTGATATSINAGVLDTVNFTDVAVFYNNAGTWQQIDIDYDIDTNGAWGASNITLWFKLQEPILASGDSPALGSGSYILCYGHTVPTVMRDWGNIYPLSDDFPGASIDTGKWQEILSGNTITVSGSIATINASASGSAALQSVDTFAEGYQFRTKAIMSVPVYGAQIGFSGNSGVAPQDYFGMYFGYLADTWFLQNYDGTTNNVTNFSATMDASYHVITLNRDPSTGQVSGSILGETESVALPGGTITGPLYARSYASGVTGGGGANSTKFDWIKIRPWAPTEPVVTTTRQIGDV